MIGKIEIYFEFGSPYSYLGYILLRRLTSKIRVETVWKPFSLGHIMKITGDKPLLTIPVEGEYAKIDLKRRAERYEIPFLISSSSPTRSIEASRGYFVAESFRCNLQYADQVYESHWSKGRDISKIEVLIEIAKSLGIDPKLFEDEINSSIIKKRLIDQTDEAWKRGVFGAPFIFIDNESYWGKDAIEYILSLADQFHVHLT